MRAELLPAAGHGSQGPGTPRAISPTQASESAQFKVVPRKVSVMPASSPEAPGVKSLVVIGTPLMYYDI